MFSTWPVLQHNFNENLATIKTWHKALVRLTIRIWGAVLPSSQSIQAMELLQLSTVGSMYERIQQYQQLGSQFVSNQHNFWQDNQ
jgi:hypothetical protein